MRTSDAGIVAGLVLCGAVAGALLGFEVWPISVGMLAGAAALWVRESAGGPSWPT